MHAVSTFVLVMGWLVAASATFAQTIVAPPTAAQRCLTRGEVTLGTPAYPQESFARRDSGRVVVELDFDRPNAAPHVKFGKTEGGAAFEDAVRDFVAAYRVPCLEPGQKTQLRQEFVFKPTDGRRVNASEPIDADELRRVRLQACVSQLRPDVRITYPPAASERAEYGTVVLRLEFTDSKSAPRVTVLDNARSSSLAFAAMAHAEGYRMPCHEGAAVDFVLR